MIIIYAYYLVGDGYIKSDDQQVLKKDTRELFISLRRVFKLILARWRSQPIIK